MRLIDADTMKESFETNCKEINKFMMDLIDNQPTTYDVDKVVEHLIKRFDYCHQMANKNDDAGLEEMAFAWRQRAEGVRDAMDLVKGGGQVE